MFNFNLPIMMEIRQARMLEITVIVVLFLQQNIGNKKQQTFRVSGVKEAPCYDKVFFRCFSSANNRRQNVIHMWPPTIFFII